jgi:hypothetical protein
MLTVAVVESEVSRDASRRLADVLGRSGFVVNVLTAEDESVRREQLVAVANDHAAVVVLVEGGADAVWFIAGFLAGHGSAIVLVADGQTRVPACAGHLTVISRERLDWTERVLKALNRCLDLASPAEDAASATGELLHWLQERPSRLASLTGTAFADAIRALLERLDVLTHDAGRDDGSHAFACRVHESNVSVDVLFDSPAEKVGLRSLRDLTDRAVARKSDYVLCICRGEFTDGAVEFAETVVPAVWLVGLSDLEQWIRRIPTRQTPGAALLGAFTHQLYEPPVLRASQMTTCRSSPVPDDLSTLYDDTDLTGCRLFAWIGSEPAASVAALLRSLDGRGAEIWHAAGEHVPYGQACANLAETVFNVAQSDVIVIVGRATSEPSARLNRHLQSVVSTALTSGALDRTFVIASGEPGVRLRYPSALQRANWLDTGHREDWLSHFTAAWQKAAPVPRSKK